MSGVWVENRLCSVGMDTSSFSLSQAEPPGFLKFIYHRAPNLLGNQLRGILHSTNFPLPLLDSEKAPVTFLTRICSCTNPSIKYPQEHSPWDRKLRSSPEQPLQVTAPWQIPFTTWFPTPSFFNRENLLFFLENICKSHFCGVYFLLKHFFCCATRLGVFAAWDREVREGFRRRTLLCVLVYMWANACVIFSTRMTQTIKKPRYFLPRHHSCPCLVCQQFGMGFWSFMGSYSIKISSWERH